MTKMESKRKPNRKQAAAFRRARRDAFGLEPFSTLNWTLEDWKRLPRHTDGWTTRPDLQRFKILRIKAVRFSDGITRRFYQVVERPETKREWEQLRERARLLVQECNAELTREIVRSERKFLKTPTPPKLRGRRKD